MKSLAVGSASPGVDYAHQKPHLHLNERRFKCKERNLISVEKQRPFHWVANNAPVKSPSLDSGYELPAEKGGDDKVATHQSQRPRTELHPDVINEGGASRRPGNRLSSAPQKMNNRSLQMRLKGNKKREPLFRAANEGRNIGSTSHAPIPVSFFWWLTLIHNLSRFSL